MKWTGLAVKGAVENVQLLPDAQEAGDVLAWFDVRTKGITRSNSIEPGASGAFNCFSRVQHLQRQAVVGDC